MAASAGHVDTIKYEYANSLSIFLFNSSPYSRSVSHNPSSYLWHLQLAERWKKLSILVTHHQRSRARSKVIGSWLLTMTQPSAASSESFHSTSLALPPRCGYWKWEKERWVVESLRGGASQLVFVLSTAVALCRCAGFTSLVPDFLSLGRGMAKPKLKNS